MTRFVAHLLLTVSAPLYLPAFAVGDTAFVTGHATNPKSQNTQHVYSASASAPHQLEEIFGSDGKRYAVNLTHDTTTTKNVARDHRDNTITDYYDAEGNITQRTDVMDGITTCQYDGTSRKTKETNAAGFDSTYTYNAAGQDTDAQSKETTYTYNALGQLSSVTDPDAQLSVMMGEFVIEGCIQ